MNPESSKNFVEQSVHPINKTLEWGSIVFQGLTVGTMMRAAVDPNATTASVGYFAVMSAAMICLHGLDKQKHHNSVNTNAREFASQFGTIDEQKDIAKTIHDMENVEKKSAKKSFVVGLGTAGLTAATAVLGGPVLVPMLVGLTSYAILEMVKDMKVDSLTKTRNNFLEKIEKRRINQTNGSAPSIGIKM